VVEAAEPVPVTPRVSLIGDSTMAAMQWFSSSTLDIEGIVGRSYSTTLDAASCRRLVVTSCRGRLGGRPQSVLPLMRSTLAGQLGDVMVVMAGYDDYSITSAVDQIMVEAHSQGVERVLWLDYRTATTYVLPGGGSARAVYTANNIELAAVAARRADLRVLAWNSFSAQQTSWFANDGIHLTPTGAVALANFIKSALDAQPTLGRCRSTAPFRGTVDDGVEQSIAPATRLGFVPLAPVRVLDTRAAVTGASADKVGVGRTVSIDLGEHVPSDAGAAALSVTSVDGCTAGHLTVYDCGARPPTSNVNNPIGGTTAGMAITSMTNGRVCIYSSSATDLVVDLIGAFTPDGDPFHPMTPTRWVDTRGGAAQLALIRGDRGSGSETQIAIAGSGGVPADATAVWLNLTIADPVVGTVLTAYPGPCGSAPLASNVNARANRSTASAVLVGLGADGSICVRTHSGASHIVVDLAGWFGPGAGGLLYDVRQPVRRLDAREQGGPASTAAQSVRLDGVSILNVTVTGSIASGHVVVEPCGSNQVSSLINTAAHEATANVIAVGGDSSGNVCATPSAPAFLIVDQVAGFVR
jgi:hypothetical protein